MGPRDAPARPLARLLGTLLGLAAAACTHPLAEVPFVVTPRDVVYEMLRLARVGPDDVVYDLGSGDGRLVVLAAQEHGARGVGVEIDPRLVARSREYARSAGVGGRVRFVEQDLFQADVGEATVVTLYLSIDLNRRLEPKLRRELRPGTRVVSHDYPIGDWAPTRVLRVQSTERVHTLYLWVVPPPGG
ncbi:MAG TPA: class I SAM-dependent methyltransferase [Methylomirabilota bacterium]|nr:class I SAM-dependent methyltransferase [Methylomirabilota bacterium]